MIVVTFALSTESNSFVRQLGERDGSPQVVVFHTGVGQRITAARIENFLNTFRPRLLISSGFAGGAAGDLAVGNLILAENFSDPQLLVEADRALRDFRPKTGELYSSDSIVDDPLERDQIARGRDAIGIDMETETIATACFTREIPLLSLRVISDTATQPLPAPRNVLFDLERQRTDYPRLLSYLLQHPGATPKMLRFSRQVRHAQDQLGRALIVLLKDDVFVAA